MDLLIFDKDGILIVLRPGKIFCDSPKEVIFSFTCL